MKLVVEKGANLLDFLYGVPSGSVKDLYVYDMPTDLESIKAVMRVAAENGVLHLIKG